MTVLHYSVTNCVIAGLYIIDQMNIRQHFFPRQLFIADVVDKVD